MRSTILILLFVFTAAAGYTQEAKVERAAVQKNKSFNYPLTKEIKHYDTIHGNVHDDPYRWLENAKDSAVEKWFRTQNSFTQSELPVDASSARQSARRKKDV